MEKEQRATIKDPLLEPYEIDLDESQFILVKPTPIKSGKGEGQVLRNAIGYYAKLDGCLMAIAKKKAAETDTVYNLSQYINQYRETLKQFTEKVTF